jgi:hypothetical protein
MQGAANRNTSGGVTGLARSSNSPVTGTVSGKYLAKGSAGVPPIMPKATAPPQPGSALGQKPVVSSFIARDAMAEAAADSNIPVFEFLRHGCENQPQIRF